MFKIYKTEQHYYPRRDPIPASIIGTAPASSPPYIPTSLVPPSAYDQPKEIVYVAPYVPPAQVNVDTDKAAEKIAEMLAPTTQMIRYENALEDLKKEQDRLREERDREEQTPSVYDTIAHQRWLEEEARRRVRMRNGEGLLTDETSRGRLTIEDDHHRRRRASSVCSHRSHHSHHSHRSHHSRSSSRDRGRVVVVHEPVVRSVSVSRPNCSRCGEYGHRSRDCHLGEVMVLTVPAESRRRARSVHYVRRPEFRYY